MALLRRCLGWLDETCDLLTTSSRCPRHRRAHKRIRNAEAPRCRAQVLASPWCGACGATEDLTGEHVVPISKGGAGGPLVTRCRSCNSSRGNRP